MASFLRKFGKKGDVDRSAKKALEQSANRTLPEAENESEAEPALVGDGTLSPEPFDFDVLGGEAEITYESVNGKKQRHYTQVYIDPKRMPVITTSRKPGNAEYLAVKHELLSTAYHSLKPYLDFVQSLKGMYGRDDLRRALEIIVKRFLTRFWDMPASKESHHAYPWGLTLHCIDVACAEAEKATAWIPMSEHGIDEINHTRYLGMVVLLHFTKGLFHDAHKLYQYEMTGMAGNIRVKFDPLRNQGNVLDFKIVYPERTETWGECIASPGKLNAIEFCALFPRELLKYAPSNQFIKVFTAIFDLEGSDSDRDSAKRDATNAGRATVEEMILSQVKAYFTADSQTTKPENSVFKVNNDWVAVLSSQFLMKIRPMEGGVFTKDGVKNTLLQEEALAGSASKYDVNLSYRVKRPNGKEEASKSKTRLAFIKSSYLLQAFPDLFEIVGQVFFDELDRDEVRTLCPSADNFVKDLGKMTNAQSPAGNSDVPAPAPAADSSATSPASNAHSKADTALPVEPDAKSCKLQITSGSGEESPEERCPAEEHKATEHESPLPDAETSDVGLCGETPVAETPLPQDATKVTAVVPIQERSRAQRVNRPMVKWSKQLMFLLEHYEAGDSCPETGWLFANIYGAFVRTPRFYEKMTNDQLLAQDDWGTIAATMCRELGQEGLLILKPKVGRINFIPPGGGGEAVADGAFFQLKLEETAFDQLCNRIMNTIPIMELDKQ